jgi:LuxR family maltose regulon positive regulatory protein
MIVIRPNSNSNRLRYSVFVECAGVSITSTRDAPSLELYVVKCIKAHDVVRNIDTGAAKHRTIQTHSSIKRTQKLYIGTVYLSLFFCSMSTMHEMLYSGTIHMKINTQFVETSRTMHDLLPVTKLRAPNAQDTVKRVPLISQLSQAVLSNRLTLISAPAGSGKTTLAADFVQSLDQVMVHWLSLDSNDNDIQPFLLAMVLAILPKPEDELIELVSQGQMQPRSLVTILINRLDKVCTESTVIVLDDLHMLTNTQIHGFLDYFIELIPSHVHVLVTTRYDPPLSLSKLRGRGELAEIRLDVLRFVRSEVDELLNQMLNLNISDTLIDLLVERTEGWIAGLRLLALSLKTIDEGKREQYITDLAQNDRYVFDLLAEEVLAQQCDDIRQFLLETSILDELTPELCAAVTQQNDAANTLRELHRNNLFLVSLGTGAYRYHALFRDFLLEQLKGSDRERMKQLHHRAATAQENYRQQLNHFMLAEAWDDAIQLIAELVIANVSVSKALRLDTSLERFPQDLQENSPWLLVIRGSLYYEHGHYTLAQPLLEKAQDLFKQDGDMLGEMIAVGLTVNPAMPYEEYVTKYEWILEQEPDLAPELRIPLLNDIMWNSIWNYRLERAEHYLMEYIDRSIQHDNPITYRSIAQYIAEPLFCTSQGTRPFDRVLPHMAKHSDNNAIIQMGLYNIKAILSVLHGELDKGHHWLTLSNEINLYYGGFAWVNVLIYNLLLAIALIKRDITTFDRIYDEAMGLFGQQDTARMKMAEFLYLRGRRLLQDEQIDEAQHIVAEMQQYIIVKEHERLHIALQAHVAHANGGLDDALKLMQQAVDEDLPIYQLPASYNIQLSLALIQWQRGEQERALQTFRDGLKPLVAWDYPGIAVQAGQEMIPLFEVAADTGIYPDFCHRCIDILIPDNTVHPVDIPDSTETLTPREVEILREIVAGASNKEIAETLFITRNTVKSHITRILGKLNAKSRTEAVARVRELNLIL